MSYDRYTPFRACRCGKPSAGIISGYRRITQLVCAECGSDVAAFERAHSERVKADIAAVQRYSEDV